MFQSLAEAVPAIPSLSLQLGAWVMWNVLLLAQMSPPSSANPLLLQLEVLGKQSYRFIGGALIGTDPRGRNGCSSQGNQGISRQGHLLCAWLIWRSIGGI